MLRSDLDPERHQAIRTNISMYMGVSENKGSLTLGSV